MSVDEADDKYQDFLQMEDKMVVGRGVDPATGWRWEDRMIGMVRNAGIDNRKKLRVFLDPAPHVVLDQDVPLRGWYKPKHEKAGARPRPCYTEALLTQPYGGACPVRCVFCYINNGLRGYRGQGVTVVDPRYPEKVDAQLRKMRTAAALYISSFTEPFQPRLEPHYRNTRRLADVANKHRLPIFFLTRQVPPGWAWDALKRNRWSYQQFSINTPDPSDWKRFSPQAASLPDLLNAVSEAHRQGIYVSIQCNPIIPGVVSLDQMEELVHLLAYHGADHVIFKFVEIVSPASAPMVEKMKRLFPDRAAAFESLWTDTIGHIRTVSEDYRMAALRRINAATKAAGITMGLCYEYGYERDGNGKIVDKAGISLGPTFTTADQCHGRRTPVYSRPDLETPFEPIQGCPPSGCLYCEEANPAGPPCGNRDLFRADALRPADFNRVAWTRVHGALGRVR